MKVLSVLPCVAPGTMKVILIAMSVSLFSGCVAGPDGRVRPDSSVFSQKNTVPLATGLVGALICNQAFKGHGSKDGWTAACGIGGYYLGQSFTAQSNDVLENNRVNQESTWVDPDGQHVTMMPTNTYRRDGRPCRDFRSTVEIDGQVEILTGEACREADGTWRSVN